MKGIFKLIPAALAVFALASCSTDVIEGSKTQEQTIANKGDLRMTFDAFDDETPTRAMRDNNFGSLTFVDGDQVNVYSEDLYNTDWYEFDTDAFYYSSTGEKMVTEPKFGVMPGKAVKKAYIDRASRTTRVDVEIPEIIKYNADSETSIDGTAMYACNLPMFGYASFPEGEEYVAVSHVRYMVGILKIDLGKAIGNASWLRLINYGQGAAIPPLTGYIPYGNGVGESYPDFETAKPLSGVLTAELYSDDDPDPNHDRTKVKLAKLDPTLETHPWLYVDLRNVPSNTSCIYIPVVPGLDGDVDYIRLEYSATRADNPNMINDWENIPGMSFPGKTFEQHKRYKGSYSFEFADMNPKLITDMLAQYQSTSNNIVIDITKSFTIDRTDGTVTNVIALPKFDNNVNVTINLAEGFGVGAAGWVNSSATGGTTDVLQIVDADPENPFTGKLTINVSDKGAGTDWTAADAGMSINLPEGTAVIAGTFNAGTDLDLFAGNIEIGDGKTATTGLIWSAGAEGNIGRDVKSITIAKDAAIAAGNPIDCTVYGENKTETITVNGAVLSAITGGPLTTAITVGADGSVTGKIIGGAAKTKPCLITVNGTVTGDIANAAGGIYTSLTIDGQVTPTLKIDLGDAVKGILTITSGDATDATFTAVAGDVDMKGDVVIAMKAEGEAISGGLTMTGAAKTLTLKQGYVNRIAVNSANAGSWEEKYINVKLDDANEGLAAFLTLNEMVGGDGHASIAKFSKSVWDGKKITNATYADKFTNWISGASNETTRIYTASQLASFGGIGGNCTLNNNIDLNNKAWAGYAQKGKFAGAKVVAIDVEEEDRAYPTISKLNLNKLTTDNTDYANGLFLNNTGMSRVENVTLAGVQAVFTGKEKTNGIGAFYGSIANAAEFEGVEVKDINISNTKKMIGVGGLVGKATAALTATSVKVAGTIDGYSCLGGFVGTTSAAATFDKCDATGIAFKQTFDSEKAMDIEYAKVGGFVGNVSNKVAIEIKGASKEPADINFDQETKMYTSNVAVGTGNFFKYHKLQNFIGFSGNDLDVVADKIDNSKINQAGTEVWCAKAHFGIPADKTADTYKSETAGGVTYNYLYNWPAKP